MDTMTIEQVVEIEAKMSWPCAVCFTPHVLSEMSWCPDCGHFCAACHCGCPVDGND